jgi:hypothetical protein
MWAIIASVLAAFVGSQMAFAQGEEDAHISAPNDWMEGYTLIVTDAENINEAYAAQEAIENKGGHVGIIFPNRVMLGWVAPETFENLIGKHKIVGIYDYRLKRAERKALESGQAFNSEEKDGIRFFNRVITGQFKPERSDPALLAQAAPTGAFMLPDALEPPALNYQDYMDNLTANGINEETLVANGISMVQTAEGASPSPGNSDYMVGKIVFTAFFVESNGSVDANEFTWTAARKTTIKDEIKAGLSWWASTAKKVTTYNTPLTFIYKFKTGRQGYEPIRHPSGDDYLWINAIMANMGYGLGNKFARTTAFNTAQRVIYNTNWSVVSFIGYNPPGAPTTFTDGYFAYAFIRGPYSQLLFRNDGWGAGGYDRVNTHETGHLFGASDEYYQAGYGGCTTCGRVSNNVYNGNCVYCNEDSIDCMMKSNTWNLCGFTPGQLGWRNATDLKVGTYRVDNGVKKEFFAPGEAIQFKTNFCVAGPQIGTEVHTVRMRYRADYFNSFLDTSGTVADDTGWGSWTGVTPPAGTGKSCWVTWWNRNVPADITYGHATLSVQLEIEGMGRQAISQKTRFFVGQGADTTEPSPSTVLFGPDQMIDEGPFAEQVPAP